MNNMCYTKYNTMIKYITTLFFVTLLISCSQNKKSANDFTFTAKEKEACVTILREYQKTETESSTQAKDYAIKIGELLEGENNGVQLNIEQNIIHVDSVVNQAIELVDNNQYKDLMILLDDNKMNFYSHPSNNVFSLMKGFNGILDLLYSNYLSEKESLEKSIEIHQYRKSLCMGLIKLRNVIGNDVESYIFACYEELEQLIFLYHQANDYPNQIENIKEIFLLIDEGTEEYNYYKMMFEEALQKLEGVDSKK